MNLPALITDNVTELLLKIIEFTQSRQKILIQNINGMHTGSFVPKDLPVDEFSKLMHQAVNEHAHSQRLVLRDGQNVKFGAAGSFKATPIIDEQAKLLFEGNRDEYLRGQISKLLENSLNQRIATELLKQKQADEQCLGRRLN
jgi:flagellar basal body rod protein FlgB